MKWYHGSEKEFKDIDPDKLKPGDYGKGLYLTDNEQLAYIYSGRKFVYEIELSTEPMTTAEKIVAMNKVKSRTQKDAVRNAPHKELKDKRGTIAVVKDLTQVVSIMKLDAALFKKYSIEESSDLAL